jgi:low temperature requirement protein LtrA
MTESASTASTVAEPTETEKRVGWAELFFDLVFVVAVTRVSTLLEHEHDWDGVLRALVVFVPIYWVWVGMAIQTNQADTSSVALRLRMFAVALAGIFMALTLEEAYGDLGLAFAFSYWFARLLLLAGIVRVQRWRAFLTPYGVSVVVTGPLLMIGALLDDVTAQTLVWGLAALIDLSTPSLLRRRLSRMHYDAAHLSERFGLFVLIALGESVVAVGTSASATDLRLVDAAAVAAAFVLSCGLWWVYFQFAADAVRHALATAQVQLNVTRLVLSYGHLAFIAAIIAVAVGMHDSIAHPEESLDAAVAGLLVGGTALYLATFGFTRWAMFHLVSWTRLTAAAVVVAVVLPLSGVVSALGTLCLLALVLIGLNVVEYARVEKIGWRALLASRER